MKIIDLELKAFYQRVESLGYTLDITPEAKNFIAEQGYDVQFGARPLKRAIQKYLEDELAEVILSEKFKDYSLEWAWKIKIAAKIAVKIKKCHSLVFGIFFVPNEIEKQLYSFILSYF